MKAGAAPDDRLTMRVAQLVTITDNLQFATIVSSLRLLKTNLNYVTPFLVGIQLNRDIICCNTLMIASFRVVCYYVAI